MTAGATVAASPPGPLPLLRRSRCGVLRRVGSAKMIARTSHSVANTVAATTEAHAGAALGTLGILCMTVQREGQLPVSNPCCPIVYGPGWRHQILDVPLQHTSQDMHAFLLGSTGS